MPVLKALLTGQPRAYGDERATQPLKRRWETVIFKQAIAGEVRANELGFEGDAVSDTLHHGGEEKAIFANSLQNYAVQAQIHAIECEFSRRFLTSRCRLTRKHLFDASRKFRLNFKAEILISSALITYKRDLFSQPVSGHNTGYERN